MLIILLAEDDTLLRELNAAYLRTRKCVVWEVGSAEEALATLATGRRFDLLVTDITMSGCMDGWELAERVHAHDASVRIVYTTSGKDDPERQVPDSIFLPKPYKPQNLLDAIMDMTGPH